MKVTSDGNLLDPQLEDGKKIIEAIYRILHKEWFPLMKEQFNRDHFGDYAIFVFAGLMLGNPSEEELIELLYEKESEYFFMDASLRRCEKIAFKILSLKPWVDRNSEMTDDPFHA